MPVGLQKIQSFLRCGCIVFAGGPFESFMRIVKRKEQVIGMRQRHISAGSRMARVERQGRVLAPGVRSFPEQLRFGVPTAGGML